MIYNPWFVDQQVDVKVVPMGVRPEDYAAFIPPLFTMTNIIGALVTMPHKIATSRSGAAPRARRRPSLAPAMPSAARLTVA